MFKTTREADVLIGAREALRPEEFFRARLTEKGVPARMHDGVIGYLFYGWAPGNFLTAVLTNDLSGAVAHGDVENIAALANYVRFFYNDVPSAAWGTRAKLDAWLSAAATVQDRISEAACAEATELCQRLTDRPTLGPDDSPVQVATALVGTAGSTPQVREIAIDWIAEELAGKQEPRA